MPRPKCWQPAMLEKVKALADVFRPYGIRVSILSVNFASPIQLGKLDTADPLDKEVIRWWRRKVKEIYTLIPDFGGFLVKANSEGSLDHVISGVLMPRERICWRMR